MQLTSSYIKGHCLFIGFNRAINNCKVNPWSRDWLIAAAAYPGFCSMKQLEVHVFLLSLDRMLVHRRSLPQQFFGVDRTKTESNQSCTCTVFMCLTCKFNIKPVTVTVKFCTCTCASSELLNPQ